MAATINQSSVHFRSFPKGDLRRCLLVLMAVDRFGGQCNAYQIATFLRMSSGELTRSLDVLRSHEVVVERNKDTGNLKVLDWGIYDRERTRALMFEASRGVRDSTR